MKNPFKKEDHTGLVISILFGSAAAGLVTFLFLTDKGKELREKSKKEIKKIAKEEAVKAISRTTNMPRKAIKALTDRL